MKCKCGNPLNTRDEIRYQLCESCADESIEDHLDEMAHNELVKHMENNGGRY